MAKMVKGVLQVSTADLDKFVKDHGGPVAPGMTRVIDKNGNVADMDFASQAQNMMNMFQNMGLIRPQNK
jgi:hypothetical protein